MRLHTHAVAVALAVLASGCHKQSSPHGAAPVVLKSDAGGGPFGLGRVATAEEIRAWDDSVLPDGTGLPEGHGTVAAGEDIFARRCASCHGPHGEGANATPLVGGKEVALGYRIGRAPRGEAHPTLVDFYPYATTLFDYTRRAMPGNAAGSLRDDEVYSVVGWVLFLNALVAQDAVIDRAAILHVKMPARARFAYEEGQPAPSP